MDEFISISPTVLLTPVPVVMVSAGDEKIKNIITVAWAGTVCSKPPMVSISLKKQRYSYDLIKKTGEFVINMVTAPLAKATDYCGVKSGRDVYKFNKMKLTPITIKELTYAPGIKESPVQMACKVKQIISLGSHDLFLAQVVGVYVKKSLEREDKSFALEKAGLVAYNHGIYQKLGEVLGFFGYSVARDKVYKKRMSQYEKDPF